MGGSFLAFIMALVFQQSGPEAFMLPLWLLAGGTLVSRLNKKNDGRQPRTAMQVFANGGVGTLCLFMSCSAKDYMVDILFYATYLASFSISICDTFSSEIGRYFKGKTWDVTSFKRVEPGLSGGISIQGTLGGMVGLLPTAWLLMYRFNQPFSSMTFIVALAFMGMLLDSMLGSLIQAKFINENGHVSEYPKEGYKLFKGYRWCTNDMVNLLSNAAIVLACLALNWKSL